MSQDKKPPARVRAINGEEYSPDHITNAEFEEAIRVQDAVLYMQGEERRILGRLRHRIHMGAVVVSDRYYFDLERGIVRTKKGPGSETKPPASGEREVGS